MIPTLKECKVEILYTEALDQQKKLGEVGVGPKEHRCDWASFKMTDCERFEHCHGECVGLAWTVFWVSIWFVLWLIQRFKDKLYYRDLTGEGWFQVGQTWSHHSRSLWIQEPKATMLGILVLCCLYEAGLVIKQVDVSSLCSLSLYLPINQSQVSLIIHWASQTYLKITSKCEPQDPKPSLIEVVIICTPPPQGLCSYS